MKNEEEIYEMLIKSIEAKRAWLEHWEKNPMQGAEAAETLRNFTALRGVIKTLLWVQGRLPEGENPLL